MSITLSRWNVIATLGGVAAAWPAMVRAEQAVVPVIAVTSLLPETVGRRLPYRV
jgi:phosphoribosylcarboxyaminoimidazole (NCAIR) mutase